jgi:release factor glutamine methyltransferase
MTLKQWRNAAKKRLEAEGISSAGIDTDLLITHVLKKDKTFVVAHPDHTLSDAEVTAATALLDRRAQHEPIAYLLGTKEFFSLPFEATNDALIPRWETETLVQTALDWLEDKPAGQTICDIGTGAGTIIVSLAHSAPQHTYLATELSPEALALAQKNAQLTTTPITFFEGNLAAPLLHDYTGKINLFCANLPYIPTGRLVTLDPTVTFYEPNIALEGGPTGLELYAQMLPQAKQLIASGALLLFEHDDDQGEPLRTLVKQHFPDADIATLTDFSGHDRVLRCQT